MFSSVCVCVCCLYIYASVYTTMYVSAQTLHFFTIIYSVDNICFSFLVCFVSFFPMFIILISSWENDSSCNSNPSKLNLSQIQRENVPDWLEPGKLSVVECWVKLDEKQIESASGLIRVLATVCCYPYTEQRHFTFLCCAMKQCRPILSKYGIDEIIPCENN